MTPLGIRIVVAILLLMIFIIVFNAAWTWMRRYDEAMKELVDVRRQLKKAREEALEWRDVAESFAGRGA